MPNIHDPVAGTPQSRWESTVDEAVQSLSASDVQAPADAQSVAHATSEFSAFLKGQWSKTAHELGSGRIAVAGAGALGDEAIADIVASTFGNVGSHSSKGDLRRAIVSANSRASETILAARQRYGAPQSVQVVPFRSDGTGEIQFSVIKQAPRIENLVLSGGGAKGVGYAPTLLEMEKHGMMSGVRHIVGTSAGALTAAVLASGLNATEFQELSDSIDMASLKDKPSNWGLNYPDLKLGMIGFHGGTAMEVLDRTSAQSVKAFLDSDDGQAKLAAAVQEGRISSSEADSMQALRFQDFNVDRKPQMVTFEDLGIMSKIDPGKFRALTLTGWNQTDKQLTYFNAENTPRMPIAIAGRISMSIPYFFAAVKYDAGQGEKSWVDGGVGSNMPAGAVLDNSEEGLKRATANLDLPEMMAQADSLMQTKSRTMLMRFDEFGKAYQVQHDPPRQPQGGIMTAVKAYFSGNPEFGAANERDRERMRSAGPNGLVVFHGDVGTLDLWASHDRKQAAGLGAQMRATEQIVLRQNQGTHKVFTDPVAAAKSLSATERAALLQVGPPSPQAFKDGEGGVDDRLYQAAMNFHDEVSRLSAAS